MTAIRVLCVENPAESMNALKYMLEQAGYEVMPATTRDQALRLLTTLHVDGVLLEYDLADATGSERALASLAQEFLLRRLTRKAKTRN